MAIRLHRETKAAFHLMGIIKPRNQPGQRDVLIQHGQLTKLVYLLVRGTVRIDGPKGTVAYIGEGDVCGEMAFLEDGLPSASAVAEEDVEAYTISWEALQDLFEMFPHLASRFYRSMAMNLSRRLRQQMASKQSAGTRSLQDLR